MAIQETPTTAWDTLWQFTDSLASATILTWAERQGLDAFVVPTHADWLHGLVVFTDAHGIHHGLPLDAQGRVSRSREVFFSDRAWTNFRQICVEQSQQWAALVYHWDLDFSI